MDKYQKMMELLKDEETAKKVFTDSVEETQKNLEVHGLYFSVDELVDFAAKGQELSEGGELSEEALDDVSGGIAALCAAALIFFGVSCAASVAKTWLKTRR